MKTWCVILTNICIQILRGISMLLISINGHHSVWRKWDKKRYIEEKIETEN